MRKVCNHPDLFEPRPIQTPCGEEGLNVSAILPSLLCLWLFEPFNWTLEETFSRISLPLLSILHNELYVHPHTENWRFSNFKSKRDAFSQPFSSQWIEELPSSNPKLSLSKEDMMENISLHTAASEETEGAQYPAYHTALCKPLSLSSTILNPYHSSDTSLWHVLPHCFNHRWMNSQEIQFLASFHSNFFIQRSLEYQRKRVAMEEEESSQRLKRYLYSNEGISPLWGKSFREWLMKACLAETSTVVGFIASKITNSPYGSSPFFKSVCLSPHDRLEIYWPLLYRVICVFEYKVLPVPADIRLQGNQGKSGYFRSLNNFSAVTKSLKKAIDEFHPLLMRKRCIFPFPSQLQDDSGKMIVLAKLMKSLHREGHRCLLFTQFTKLLDVLENFINFLGFTYVRLDGSTKVEMRQKIVTRFNENIRIFLFISSTRSGGIGLNLTGADVVIFYDTDWNPAMDRQAMDRCHRIGQTRDVHVYRLVCEHTIEENIWKKQLQKRQLDEIVIDQGQFTSDWFSNAETLREIFQESVENSDTLFKDRVLHDTHSSIGHTTGQIHQRRAIEKFEITLTTVEDVDDVRALKASTKETANERAEFAKEFVGESGDRQGEGDAAVDALLQMPSLVAYCVRFIEENMPPSLSQQIDEMKEKIKREEITQVDAPVEEETGEVQEEKSGEESSVWESEVESNSDHEDSIESGGSVGSNDSELSN
ncbi:SWI2/SNF2 SRCAP/Ino80 [Cardiosporidium cionae]|uniref:SWI2/SNF2 SRCAP/Ino80 n=1 Tax=Cardiosporidium cionae TaxID=476202 RepID=A0ABQ7J5A6_9APIC|nr:SWI2/SNF2 SRCAP/Ino80 [Cardiosporidium cionae]|eukprot:KAF8819138.1 SWI2/SNF2 SRCAP/Ino80 [Cardiosporidium cionae]